MNWEKILKRKRRIIPPTRASKKKVPQDKYKYVSNVASKKELYERFRKKMHEKAKDVINEQFEYLLAKELQHWEDNVGYLKKDPAKFEAEIKIQEKHIEYLKALTPEEAYLNALPSLNKGYDESFNPRDEPHEHYSKFISGRLGGFYEGLSDIIRNRGFGEP